MSYASFWKRAAAYLIDGIIYGIIMWIVLFVIAFCVTLVSFGKSNVSPMFSIVLFFFICSIQLAGYILYYVWPESSSWQATIGKKIFKLKVTDLNGQRISFWRSLGRTMGMIVSSIILCIGYLMCFWTEKKQCLHDQMAGCLVIDQTPNEKQGCAIAVLVGYVLFIVMMVRLFTAISIPQYGRAVEKARMTEAYTTIQNANRARLIRGLTANTPVTEWNQLEISFDCTVRSNPRVCASQNFIYEMTDKTVKATRTGGTEKYVLSIDTTGNVTCDGQSSHIRTLCQQFTR